MPSAEQEFDLTYISLGAGLQSTFLYLASTMGLYGVPGADIAVFADTGDEPAWVYDQLERIRAWDRENGGPPIYTAQKGVLSEWVIERQRKSERFVTVPLYTIGVDGAKEGMLRRQCTREFKVEPIETFVRAYLGYQPRYKVRQKVQCLLGISIDEVQRMRPSRVKWITNVYPLVEAGIERHRCGTLVQEITGWPEPKKSACVYCPYRSDREWHEMKEKHPEEFARAVAFDEAVRDMTMAGRKRPAFVHRSCVPLGEAKFDTGPEGQGDLFGEDCEGMCGL